MKGQMEIERGKGEEDTQRLEKKNKEWRNRK